MWRAQRQSRTLSELKPAKASIKLIKLKWMTRIGATAGLAVLAGMLYLALRHHRPNTSLQSSAQHDGASTLPAAAALERGHRLAQTYCQSCHLFPDPALLDKATWEHGALPEMAPW